MSDTGYVIHINGVRVGKGQNVNKLAKTGDKISFGDPKSGGMGIVDYRPDMAEFFNDLTKRHFTEPAASKAKKGFLEWLKGLWGW